MMRLIGRARRFLRGRDGGQSLVEFTLLIPVLMIFVVAVIDFGKMLLTYQVMTNAAREGARRAAVANDLATEASVRSAIIKSLDPVIDSAKVQFVAKNPDGSCPAMTTGATNGYALVYGCGWDGTPTTVTDAVVGIAFDYKTVLLGRFLESTPGTFPLKTRMVYRNE
ncbi:MAG TPA: TadE/TadG family type IV pilus assembly protein [Longimicrobiaceae bacterium]|jgi:Flp pilus assembly protein TadG